MPGGVTVREDDAGGPRGDEALRGVGGRKAGVGLPGHSLTSAEQVSTSCSRAESLGKGRRMVSICSCDFTSETHPQSLGLGAHFSGYCLELSLWIYLVWRFKGEALCLELRKPRPAASKTVCPHPPPSFQPSLLASARLEELGGFARSFRHKELPLAHPGGDHGFPECRLPLSLNNQGGDTS